MNASCELKTLRCPQCKTGELQFDQALYCSVCAITYPVVAGVPVLINDKNSVFSIADYCTSGEEFRGDSYGKSTDSRRSIMRRIYHQWVGKLLNFAIPRSHLDAEKALTRVQNRIGTPTVLVIGAGDAMYEGAGRFTYTDVAFGKNTTIICDAHDLPFPDGFFDLALVVAVLEHVADPDRCVNEIWRVLKPRGSVYAATPFLQPVHMGAHDFTRFTYLGHRRLFRRFDDEESGMALGPAAALAWSLQYFVVSLTDRRWLRNVFRLFTVILSVPIKLLDYLTRGRPVALDGAAGVFFFGQKRETSISDRQIINLYRGAG